MQRFHDYMHCLRAFFFRPLIVIFFVAYSSQCEIALAQSELRTWHSASGGFSIEAELEDYRAGKVQLKKKDGTTIWVDLKSLSLRDIRYVNQEMAKAQQAVPSDPVQSDAADRMTKDDPAQPVDPTAEVGEPDEPANAPAPADDQRLPGWSVESDFQIPKNPFAGMREGNMRFDVSATQIKMSDVRSPYFLSTAHEGAGTQLIVGNLRTGKYSRGVQVKGYPSEAKVNPEGTLVAYTDGHPTVLYVHQVSNGRLLTELKLDGLSGGSDLYFLAGQQVLILHSFTQMKATLIDVKSAKIVKEFEVASGYITSKAVVHPNSAMFALKGSNGTILLFDIKRGQKVGEIIPTSKADDSKPLQVEAMSFCGSGDELAMVSTSDTEFHVYSLRTGRPIVKHVLKENLSSITSDAHLYKGPVIESFEDKKKGWLLYGKAIIDPQLGGPVWLDNRAGDNRNFLFRAIADDQHLVSLPVDYSGATLSVADVPWGEIEKSKAVVSKGGNAEDSGLPPIQVVNRRAGKIADKASVSQLYQGKPIVPKLYPAASNIALPPSTGYFYNVHWSDASSAICVAEDKPLNSDVMSAHIIDSNNKKFIKSISLPEVKSIAGLSPNGKWLITTTGKSEDRFDIYSVPDGKHVAGLRPFQDSKSRRGRTQAKFIANDLLITFHNGEEAVVWEVPALTPRYRFPCDGWVEMFPSGDKFMYRSEGCWQIRASEDGKFLGSLESTPQDIYAGLNSIHINADESACASLVGSGHEHRLMVWDLTTGKIRDEIYMPSVSSSSWVVIVDENRRLIYIDPSTKRQVDNVSIKTVMNLVWCGKDELLLVWNNEDNSRFANPNQISSVVVSWMSVRDRRVLWDFRIPAGVLLKNNPHHQIWYRAQDYQSANITGIDLPSALAVDYVKKAPAPVPILPSGSSVHLDVTVNLSGEPLADGLLADQIKEAVKASLTKGGVSISDRAGIKLTVIMTNAVERSEATNSFEKKLMISCQISDISDTLLWKRDRFINERAGKEDEPVLVEDVRKKQWAAALQWLSQTVVPQSIFDQWYYRGIGESLLTPNGEKLVELKANKNK